MPAMSMSVSRSCWILLGMPVPVIVFEISQ